MSELIRVHQRIGDDVVEVMGDEPFVVWAIAAFRELHALYYGTLATAHRAEAERRNQIKADALTRRLQRLAPERLELWWR